MLAKFLAARRYASGVLACLSVCVSVRHKPVLYLNGWADRAVFGRGFPRHILQVHVHIFEGNGDVFKFVYFCVQTPDIFRCTVAKCCQQSTDYRRLLITLSVQLCAPQPRLVGAF